MYLVDIKPYVDQLVKAGVASADAEVKVKALIDKIKIKKGDNITDEDINKFLRQGFAKAASSTGDKVDAICIGYTPLFDKNKKYTENILTKYNDAAQRQSIIDAGAVKFEKDANGRDVMKIMDIREFKDVGGKFKNANFGKEAKPNFDRIMFFIDTKGQFFEMHGRAEPKIGGAYHITSKTFGKMIYAVNLQQFKTYTQHEMWDLINNFAASADIAQTLDVIQTFVPYQVGLTTGFITHKGLNVKTNQYWTVIKGETPMQNGFGTSANEEVAVAIENALIGSEVFALVRARKPYEKDGQTKFSFDVIGIYINPEAEQNNELFADMDIIISE